MQQQQKSQNSQELHLFLMGRKCCPLNGKKASLPTCLFMLLLTFMSTFKISLFLYWEEHIFSDCFIHHFYTDLSLFFPGGLQWWQITLQCRPQAIKQIQIKKKKTHVFYILMQFNLFRSLLHFQGLLQYPVTEKKQNRDTKVFFTVIRQLY